MNVEVVMFMAFVCWFFSYCDSSHMAGRGGKELTIQNISMKKYMARRAFFVVLRMRRVKSGSVSDWMVSWLKSIHLKRRR
jgi:hypothetical protein